MQNLAADYAEIFSNAKQTVLYDATSGCTLTQYGPAVTGTIDDLGGTQWPTDLVADEALIETFVVRPGAEATPTGADAELSATWQPLAQAMADHVFAVADAAGVALVEPAYLTTSVTPVGLAVSDPHFDDDLFSPSDGVGLVAIVGSIGGPRVASGRLPVTQPSPGAQVVLSDAAIAAFDQPGVAVDGLDVVQTPDDTIVVFPQFGQLHAGPKIDVTLAGSMRYLMVMRAATLAATTSG